MNCSSSPLAPIKPKKKKSAISHLVASSVFSDLTIKFEDDKSCGSELLEVTARLSA